MNLKISKIKKSFLDLLFPIFCVGCGKEEIWLCQSCFSKIVKVSSPVCPYCNKITIHGEFCSRCRRKTALTGIMVTAYYDEGPLKEAIHAYKYNFIFHLAQPLSTLLRSYLRENLPKGKKILIPVPLHKKREVFRGFNQATLLAKELKEEFGFKINTDLLRIKNTRPQIELKGQKRHRNVKEAFLYQGENLKGKTVLLIDDVCTTGATLNECAKELRGAGARQIWGLVLARH